MANMGIAYRGPDPSLVALVGELRGFYGNPARTYEFVTGYKSPDNFSGHNPDSNGVVHAVDIFTDDFGNIPQVEGRVLAERLRLVGAATNRFSYLIHDMSAGAPQPMIAGQFNGWVWQAYGGVDAHSDHIHVSIADGYWGDPCNVSASVTNDTSRWGVTGGAKPQSGTITPIPLVTKDWFDMATKADLKAAVWEVLGDNLSSAPAAGKAGTVGWALMNGRNHAELANRGAANAGAQVAALTELVKQLAKGQGVSIDYAKVEAATAAGVAKAMAEGVALDATVTVKKGVA